MCRARAHRPPNMHISDQKPLRFVLLRSWIAGRHRFGNASRATERESGIGLGFIQMQKLWQGLVEKPG